MGRVLQKKKRRSGISKARRKPPSKKKILQNPIIAANWDQKETLTQNYRRLGLISKLNSSAGGREKDVRRVAAVEERRQGASEEEDGDEDDDEELGAGMIVQRIQRVRGEEKNKTVEEVRIEIGKDGQARVVSTNKKPNPLNDMLNDLSDDDGEDIENTPWEGLGSLGHVAHVSGSTAVVADLEKHALSGARKEPRKQSQREEEWVERLVNKYGDDYGRMSRDTRLNVMQQSEGDIKRRVRKWKAKHGNET